MPPTGNGAIGAGDRASGGPPGGQQARVPLPGWAEVGRQPLAVDPGRRQLGDSAGVDLVQGLPPADGVPADLP